MPLRKNLTFSHQQNIRLKQTMVYRVFKSPTSLRREFQEHFILSPRQLLHSLSRFIASSDVSHSKLPDPPRSKNIEENIDTERNLSEEKPNSSISDVSTAMNLFTGAVWKIVRKTSRKYPNKPKTVQSFTDQHKLCRVHFCNWRGI